MLLLQRKLPQVMGQDHDPHEVCWCDIKFFKKNTHPFSSHFYGNTRVSRYQKGKTNVDFIEARDSDWQWHQLGHMQLCMSLQAG